MQESISIKNLYKHQIDFLKKNPNKSSLVHSCGTGKTRTSLEWSKLSKDKCLVICPKPLKTNWKREADKWSANIFILTKEEFRRDHKKLPYHAQVIVDEVHNGFLTPGFKSQMSKALKWYLKEHKVPRVLLLSATVYTSSAWNIYNLAHYMGIEWNYVKFRDAFFTSVWMGRRQIPVQKKGSEKALANITKKIASVVNIEDCMDVPEQLHCDPEYFELTAEQEHSIKENYDPLPIVRYTAQHEIENGILLANEFRSAKSFKYDKLDRIIQLVEENPKVAIIARYNAQIDHLAEVLKEYAPYIIRGDVKDRDAVCLSAEKEDKAVVLIQADSSMGYQLPSFGLCIFVSMSYSYTNWKQMCGRFLRIDRPSRTTFMYLLTEGDSIDLAVYNSIQRKEDFSIELYAKIKK